MSLNHSTNVFLTVFFQNFSSLSVQKIRFRYHKDYIKHLTPVPLVSSSVPTGPGGPGEPDAPSSPGNPKAEHTKKI